MCYFTLLLLLFSVPSINPEYIVLHWIVRMTLSESGTNKPVLTKRNQISWVQSLFWNPKKLHNKGTYSMNCVLNCQIFKKEEWSYRGKDVTSKNSSNVIQQAFTGVEQLERQTVIKHLLQVFQIYRKQYFDSCLAKSGHDHFMSKILLYLYQYFKDVVIYIVSCLCNNNARKILRM